MYWVDFLAHPKPSAPIINAKPILKPSNADTDIANRNKDTDSEKPSINAKTSVPDVKKSVVTTVAPKVLVQRENFLIKRIITSEPNIKVELFDNGTIDNDTISLYHNNEQVIKKGKLNYQPLTYSFNCGTEPVSHN